jgi:hypothetical protein
MYMVFLDGSPQRLSCCLLVDFRKESQAATEQTVHSFAKIDPGYLIRYGLA